MNRAAERQRRADRTVDRAPVQHRQRARQPEAHRTDVRVGRRAERGAAAAEDLRGRQELGVDFEPDDGLVLNA